MKQLSDLLLQAKAEAPPPGIDIDDVVAAGRTRQRRRTTGWALAAVVAVAATVAAPQILVRPEAVPPPMRAATSATPVPGLFPILAQSRPFDVGDLRVGEPFQMGLDGSVARIERAGAEAGSLWILPPGASKFPWGTGVPLGSETINGRAGGYFRAGATGSGPEFLKWEYADGATAVVWLSPGLGRAEGKAVAEAFEPVADKPATIGFQVGHVPDDYRLTGVSTGAVQPIPMRLSFLTTDVAQARLRDDQAYTADAEPRGAALSVLLTSAASSKLPEGEVRCDGGQCRLVRQGVLLESKGLPEEAPEMKQMLESIIIAEDLDDRSTWFSIDDAVPASARLPQR